MKKISSILLATAIATSVITGCNSAAPSETSATAASSGLTEASASVSDPTETTVQEPQSFEELYATQLTSYLDHQYYFDGEAIPTYETNFYFINSFLDLSGYAQMGYYPSTTLGYIDLSAEYSGDEYETYGDYFVAYAENSIESTYVLIARAKAEEVTLSDDTQQAIDDMFETMRTGKAANAGKTLDEYLQFYYGPGNDEANFRKVLENYYLADAYSAQYCDNYEFSDDVKFVPYLRYALFYAPDSAAQADKDKALEAANAMKDACTSIDDLTGLAETALANGTVYDEGDIAVPKGQMVAKFEEWAYGEDRYEGELDVIYAPEYGYFVVGYLGLKEQSKDTLDQIALKELSQSILDEIDEDIHDFHTDDVYLPAPAAPTATPVPEGVYTGDSTGFDPYATSPSDPYAVQTGSTMSTTDVLVVVFITLAAVAVAAVVVILINYAIKNKNSAAASDDRFSSASKSKSRSYYDDDEYEEEEKEIEDEEDEAEEEEEAEEKKPASKPSNNSSKNNQNKSNQNKNNQNKNNSSKNNSGSNNSSKKNNNNNKNKNKNKKRR